LSLRQAELARGINRGVLDPRILARSDRNPLAPVVGPLEPAWQRDALSQAPSPVTIAEMLGQGGPEPDIAGLEVFTVPGVRATMLVCKLTLRADGRVEPAVERVMNEVRQLWFRPNLVTMESTPPGYSRSRGAVVLQTPGGQQTRSSDLPDRLGQILVARTAIQVATGLGLDTDQLLERGIRTAVLTHFGTDPRVYQRELAALSDINHAQIQRFAYRYLDRERARIVKFVPGGGVVTVSLPAAAAATGPARGAWADADYDPQAVLALAHAPGAAEFREVVLKNGLRVVAGRRVGIPMVTATLSLLRGATFAEAPGAAELATTVWQQGSHAHGKLDAFGARDRSVLGRDVLSYEIQAGSDHLGRLLAMLSDRVGSLRIARGAVEDFRRRRLPVERARELQPEVRAEAAFWRALYGDHPYGKQAGAAELTRLDDRALREWVEQALDPRAAVLTLVGELDPDSAIRQAEQWLGSWRPPVQGEVQVYFGDRSQLVVSPTVTELPTGRRAIVTDGPDAPRVRLRLGCRLSTSAGVDSPAPELLAELIAAELRDDWQDRLGAAVRVEGVGETLRGELAHLTITADLVPDQLTEAMARLRELWDGLLTGQIDMRVANRVRWRLARRYTLRYTTTRALGEGALALAKRGLPVAALDSYPERLAALDGASLTKALATCADSEVLVLSGAAQAGRAALAQAWR
jgi:zinc protease